MADEDLELASEEEVPKSSKKMIIIIALGVILLIALGGTAGFFLGVFDDEPAQSGSSESADGKDGGKSSAADEDSAANLELTYWPLEPPFVLNFEGKSKARYMQIGLEAAMNNEKTFAAVKKHLPVIRSEIVLLLSGQKYEEMVTPEGKEQLRAELIEVINTVLKQRKTKKGITNIYFTSFVMQ